MTKHYVKTSESVSIGHPDKVCDQISDNIFDYVRTLKKDAQFAVECCASANFVFLFGEIDKDIVKSSKGQRNIEKDNSELVQKFKNIALTTIREIGYDESEYNPQIITDIVTQSQQINNAVEANNEHESTAGDQGIVTGFAIAETESYHALHFILSHIIMKKLEKDRENNFLPWLKPDAKSQVTVSYEYNERGIDQPISIDKILVSQSHDDNISINEVRHILQRRIQEITLEFLHNNKKYLAHYDSIVEGLHNTEILVNPAGAWTDGGPAYDSGLVGRKLVVDNYGSAAPIGGGATSSKNFNKVDRSGAYYARYIAKSIVYSGLAQKCLVELGFAIGIPEAISINIETFGTETTDLVNIDKKVKQHFDFKVSSMIELADKIYKASKTSQHGNYTDDSFPWEKPILL